MRALRDFNTPKIPANDIPIFLRLISDLFPGLELSTKLDAKLVKQCQDACKESGLVPEDIFVKKVTEFQELLNVRHSVMLLGPAGCGKSSVWKTLAACKNFGLAKPVCMYDVVNPKSVTTNELYGYMTLAKDWKDGVLSIIMRNMSKNVSPYTVAQTSKWVVLDGDIDAVWIESMNTVMDDNKVLTLVSNERIPLSAAMRMVFEIHTLKNATPATVSRAGILYINDTDVGYEPYMLSWLKTRTVELEKKCLSELFERYVGKIVDFYQQAKLQTIVPLPLISIVQNMLALFDGMLKTNLGERDEIVLERVFLYSAMWAFGGALTVDKHQDHKKSFTNFFRNLSKQLKFPSSGDAANTYCFDYLFDFVTGEPIPWADKVSTFSSSATDMGFMVVPTADTVRLNYLMDKLVQNQVQVMFVGSAGTGKTVLVSDYLSSLSNNNDSYKYTNINMNFYTDSASLQNQLEQSIDKRSGKTYGPPGNSKLVYFIDDLNLPFVETYGTQTPIALMRQHIDHNQWFDRSDMSLKKTIADCQYMCAMNHKSGSFFVDPRLQRHFFTIACQMPGDDDLTTIFGTIINGHIYNWDKKMSAQGPKLTDATIALHKEVSTKFLPSAVKFHYNFTMRDLAAVFKGLLNAHKKDFQSTMSMTRLWYHEVLRVYADRLTSEVEVQRCKEMIVNVGKRFMDDNPEVAYADPVTFTHFVDPNKDEPGNYQPIEDQVKLKKLLERKLEAYNESHAIMDLVLFDDAIRHVIRISRILMFPGGNALLIGVGGSGKQSLSKLASSICQNDLMQISVTSDFGINDFKEVLRDMYRKSGVKPGTPLTFLMTDTQVTDERFLVYINDLLSSGFIPDLFTKEEYDGIFTSLRNIAKAEGIPDNRDSMMNYFINRVRANLHVVLCFSPVGDSFRQRARKFPGIINCTAIDWFQPWPKDALVSVAQKFLEDVQMSGKPETRDNIAYHIAEVHTSVGAVSEEYMKKERRYNYTTPKSFLELISFYKQLLGTRQKEQIAAINRLDTGLNTLIRTNKDVEELQVFLKEKQKEVDVKKAACDVLIEDMGRQRSEAEAQQAVADKEKEKADAAAEEAMKLEQQAAGDLAVAKPALVGCKRCSQLLRQSQYDRVEGGLRNPCGCGQSNHGSVDHD